jgi:hypothetical protein
MKAQPSTLPAVDVAALAREVAELRRRMDVYEQRAGLSAADVERLTKILPAISGLIGSNEFMVRDVMTARSIAMVFEGLSARSLGRLFRRAERRPIDGLIVEQYAEEAGQVLWTVREIIGVF